MTEDKGKRLQRSQFQHTKPLLKEILPAERAVSALKHSLGRLRDRLESGDYEGIESELQQLLRTVDKRIKEHSSQSVELNLIKGSTLLLLSEYQTEDDAQSWLLSAIDLFDSDAARTQLEKAVDHLGDYGVSLARLGRDRDAFDVLRRAVQKDTNDPAVYFELGHISHRDGDLSDSRCYFEKAVELAPDNASYVWALSERLIVDNEIDRASNYLLDALVNSSNAGMLEWTLRIGQRLIEIDPDNVLGRILQGEALLQVGAIEESVELLERAAELAPADPSIAYLLSVAEQQLFNFDEALELADKGLSIDPDHTHLWLQKANILLTRRDEGDFDQAEIAIGRSLEISPEDIIGRIAQADFYVLTDRYEEALMALDNALALLPDEPYLVLQKAYVLRVDGKHEEALELVGTVASRPDLTPESLLEVSDHFVELERPHEALRMLDKALRMDDRLVEGLVRKGRIFVELNQPQDALAAFERVITIEPENAEALLDKTLILLRLRRWDESLEVVGRALRGTPDDSDLLLAKVEALLGKEEYDVAAQVLREAIDILSGFDYWYHLGLIKSRKDQHDEALQCFEKAINEYPLPDATGENGNDSFSREERASVLREMASAMRMLGRNDEAVEKYDASLSLSPRDSSALVEKGLALAELGREDEAIDAMAEAVDLNPGDAEMLYFQGFVFEILECTEEALSSYTQALSIQSDYADVLSRLSSVLQIKGELTRALQLIEKALASDPNNSDFLGTKASILTDMGEYEAAVRTVDQIESEATPDSWLLSVKGWALENLGVARAAEAKEAYEEALAQAPEFRDDAWARKGLANVLRMLGDAHGAQAQYRMILSEFDDHAETVDADTLSMLGWCNYQIGEFEAAVDDYMAALSLDDEMPATQLDLALAIMCMGRYKLGAREYRNVLERVQQFEAARQRGLLSVAIDDLREAIEKSPRLLDSQEVKEVISNLDAALSEARSQAKECSQNARQIESGEGHVA